MILTSFKYQAFNWFLSGLNHLGPSNLIVGSNSSGKSRTLHALDYATAFISMKPTMKNEVVFEAEFSFEINSDTKSRLDYSFKYRIDRILEEKMVYEGRTIIDRTPDKAILQEETINPPEDKLIVQVRRDKTAYPEIEMLMEWAERVTYISFSDINTFTTTIGPSLRINPLSFSDLVKKFTEEEKQLFYEEARKIGYDISNIEVIDHPGLQYVSIKEKFIDNKIEEFNLSNGMMRVLYLLAFLIRMKNEGKYVLLLIDDLGEGLDYFKAVKLGEKVFENCEASGIQLIASSNDSFLMDIVDLSKWQLLYRTGSQVKSLNASAQPELFKEFSLTGLSNFDFFSSDFLSLHIESVTRDK